MKQLPIEVFKGCAYEGVCAHAYGERAGFDVKRQCSPLLSGHHLHVGDGVMSQADGAEVVRLRSMSPLVHLHLWSSLSYHQHPCPKEKQYWSQRSLRRPLPHGVGCSGPAADRGNASSALPVTVLAVTIASTGWVSIILYSWSLPLAPAALMLLWSRQGPHWLLGCRLSQSSPSKRLGPPMTLPV